MGVAAGRRSPAGRHRRRGAIDDSDIMALPSMKSVSTGDSSDADVKAAARAGGPRGKVAWLDSFFEYLSDSFRPLLCPARRLLIIAFVACWMRSASPISRAENKPATWAWTPCGALCSTSCRS